MAGRQDEIRRRHAGSEPLLGIDRAMGLARATVRKYATAGTIPARLPHGAGSSLLDPHVAYLAWRIGDGRENAMALWREIRKRGYVGTSRQVHRFAAERRMKPVRSGRKPRYERTSASETPVTEYPLAPARHLAGLPMQPLSALDASDTAVMTRVEQDDTTRMLTDPATRSTALVCAAVKGKTDAGDQEEDAPATIDA